MNQKKAKRIRHVEIYFVLYLAALIFILPDTKDNGVSAEDSKRNPILQLPFRLIPEKNILNCRLIYDSSGAKIIAIDSVNAIYYTGDVDEVQFEFEVEDQSLNQNILIKSGAESRNRYFRIQEKHEQQAAFFYWSPPLHEKINKTYLVHVKATAKPKVRHDFPDLVEYSVNASFSLNVNFINSGALTADANNPQTTGTLPFDNNQFNQNQQITTQPLQGGEVILKPDFENVSAVANQKWNNQIFVLGANLSDLLKTLQVNVYKTPANNTGNAKVTDINANKITLSGITPNTGKMKVELSYIRKYDNKRFLIDFLVSSQLLPDPDYDKIMYPERQYEINPRMPLINSQETRAYLKDYQSVRAVSRQGESFRFTPDISDTGKTLSLERYVNDTLVGQVFKIQVRGYPSPEIIRIGVVKDNTLNIEVRSFGMHDGRKNLVKSLEIEGNAKSRQIAGRYREDTDNLVYLHVFEITPKNPDKPFIFKLYALDQRGFRSAAKSYPE
ncbi:MAG: hypothetical protein QG635_684 [Bacteroidota bacterium]|nr:hypothetical protein [Bacteroidota bacterium]